MIKHYLAYLKDSKILAISGCCLFIFVMIGIFMFTHKKTEIATIDALVPTQINLPNESENSEEENQKIQKIFVEIKGAVVKEGVYELDSGSRVTDLVQKAEGLLQDADHQSINLAKKLTDEDSIYVAHLGEEPLLSQWETGISEEHSTIIDLNKATLTDLMTISGVGSKRAQDILDYREQNGRFKTIDDLKNVSGIGDKTFEKIKDSICVN